MDRWLISVKDQAEISEKDMIRKMWNEQDHPPATDAVLLKRENGKIILSSSTPGASIGYKIISPGIKESASWFVYSKPLTLQKGQKIKAIAQRIGYEKSIETSF